MLRQRKRILILLSLLLLFLSIRITAASNEITVNENYVNVRSGPGTNYEVLGQVHKDETYPLLKQQGDWVEIQLDNQAAWIITDFITIQQEETESGSNQEDDSTEQADIDSVSIPYDNTQIRNGPSTDYDIIYYAEKGHHLNVTGETGEWLKVESDEVEGFVLKALVEKQNNGLTTGLEGKTIVIDPGHGGDDSGAIGANETLEKDLTYKTAQELEQELKMLGAEVIMTRDRENFVSLSSRANLANVLDTDAFISLHYNSVPDLPDVTGIGTYYFHDQYESLAQYIQSELIKESGDRDRGMDFGDFQVIRQNLKPGALIELGFISNPEIEQLLLTNAYQKKLVTGIVNGLQRYFATN
ncbi:N-acetylmuramoyl-L-alanine amidase [Ornithinibacillus xuwenensis]|uniref:N-acetylmuramoyl-L-alanine amidase n=1 Tax=Ornithinibacillus xuwenensis TaxID=3144668 RepID=A0ABU9XCA4_9BACI